MLLALKLPNQSLNGPIDSIRDQAAKLLWIPRNSVNTVIFITPNFLQEVSLTAKWRLRHRFTTWKRTDPWTTLMPILNSHVQAHPMCKADKVDARQTSELLISKYLEAASNIQHKLGRTGQAFFCDG